MKAHVRFDGASLGNPGPMGAGAVVDIVGLPSARKELAMPLGDGTNNEAEYHGLILGLRHALAAGADEVEVAGDSQLVIRQLEGKYTVKAANLRPLHDEARRLLARFRRVKLRWVPRDENADADRLSMDGALASKRARAGHG